MQQSNTHTSFHVQFVTQYLLPLTDTFFGLCPSRNRYIKPLKHYVSEAGSAPVFRQAAPSLLDPLDQACQTCGPLQAHLRPAQRIL